MVASLSGRSGNSIWWLSMLRVVLVSPRGSSHDNLERCMVSSVENVVALTESRPTDTEKDLKACRLHVSLLAK